MKRTIPALILLGMSVGAYAAKGDSTKEHFMANQKRNAEAKGLTFNVAKAEKMFEQLDTNGDGIASGAEKQAYWNKGSAPAKPAAKPTAAPKRQLANGESTLEMFLATQKKKHEQKGWSFDEARFRSMFTEMDVDNNGIIDGSEKKAFWSTK